MPLGNPPLPDIITSNARLLYDFSNSNTYVSGSTTVYDLSGYNNNATVAGASSIAGQGWQQYLNIADDGSTTLHIPRVLNQTVGFTYYLIFSSEAIGQFNSPAHWTAARFLYDGAGYFNPIPPTGMGGYGTENEVLGGYGPLSGFHIYRVDVQGANASCLITTYVGGSAGYITADELTTFNTDRDSRLDVGGFSGQGTPRLLMVALYETSLAPDLDKVYNTIQYRLNETNNGVPIFIAPSTITAPRVDVPYSQTFTSTNGTAPYTYTATVTPPGLSLSTDGILSGTLTEAGGYTFTITSTDSLGVTGTRTYKFLVADITTPTTVGKISGPLLAPNLIRNGVDLAFENRLLYLQVNNKYLGINSDSPSSNLTVGTSLDHGGTGAGSIRTVNLIGTGTTDFQNITISNDTISTILSHAITIQPLQYNGTLYSFATNYQGGTAISNQSYIQIPLTSDQATTLGNGAGWAVVFADQTTAPVYSVTSNFPSAGIYTLNFAATVTKNFPLNVISPNYSAGNPEIVVPGLSTANLSISGNTIQNTQASGDVNIIANGTGQVNLNSSVLVRGNLHATGDITFDGDIQFGDQPSDLITILAEVNSDIVPAPDKQLFLESGDGLIAEDNTPIYWESNTTYNLGSSTHRWNYLYANTLIGGPNSTVTIDSTTLSSLQGGNVLINSNVVSNVDPTQDVNIAVSGTGSINFANAGIVIKDNTITTTPGTPLTIANTGTGYTKFAGDGGVVIASGTTNQRPANPVIGTLRYNLDNDYCEVYDPNTETKWIGINGTSPILSLDSVNDVADVWALIFA